MSYKDKMSALFKKAYFWGINAAKTDSNYENELDGLTEESLDLIFKGQQEVLAIIKEYARQVEPGVFLFRLKDMEKDIEKETKGGDNDKLSN